jgi:prevent-host-death family protein
MPTFTLTEARNHHGEVFDRAFAEPVILTKNGRPSHVVLSADLYGALTQRLAELEDQLLGEKATEALSGEKRVGSTRFTNALRKMTDARP